ncbi:MAG: tRNA (adenosine(37)-N6)-dimethylallyltransferase MiaA [Pseudomonadota bacterium]
MGPTACGKSDAAIALAKKFPLEIISVDSTMVYRGLNIGSAKPSAAILSTIPHHLIDIRDPKQPYSAADFCQDATETIDKIRRQGQMPLLVGGTMLYFKALQQGLSALPPANPQVRQAIVEEAEKAGWPALHDKLTVIDPKSAQRIHQNDCKRLQRALEVYEITGETLSSLQHQQKKPSEDYIFVNIALIPDNRAVLRQKIAQRFDHMLDNGFIDEARALYQRGDLNTDLPAIRSVGYRQLWYYFKGTLTFDEMREQAIIASCQLAKRQLTWLRSWENLHIFNSQDENLVEKLCHFLHTQTKNYGGA